jgi:hypothetical protein
MGIDQKPGSKTKGADLKQFGCDSPKTAHWRYEVIQKAGANGFPTARFTLTNSDELCLGVDNARTNIGAQLSQFKCDKAPNQQWALRLGTAADLPSPPECSRLP